MTALSRVIVDNRRVLLVEPFGEGHQFTLYVPAAINGIRKRGWQVELLTTRFAASTPAFRLMLDQIDGDLTVHFMSGLSDIGDYSLLRLFRQQVRWWVEVRRMVRVVQARTPIDIVYVPSVDWLLVAIQVFGSPFGALPYVMLIVSPKLHLYSVGIGNRRIRDVIFRSLYRYLLRQRKLRAVLTIDPLFVSYCHKMFDVRGSKVRSIPDFAELRGSGTRDECRVQTGVGKQEFVLLAYGALTSRKGLDCLFRAMAHPDTPPETRVLLAGVPDASVCALLQQGAIQKLISSGRVIPRLYFHSTQEEYTAFQSSDAVWLGYDRRFTASSGVLHLAIQGGLPVIASDVGLVGYTVRRYRLGELIDPDSVDSVAAAIRRLATTSRCKDALSRDLAEFSARHSANSHAAVLVDALS